METNLTYNRDELVKIAINASCNCIEYYPHEESISQG